MQKIILSMVILLTSLSIFAQDKDNKISEGKNLTTENKIDTIYVLQKKIYKTIKREPLKNKKYGIDINPIRLLFITNESNSFSGGFSLFNVDRKVEIYFPLYYSATQEDYRDSKMFSIDCRYRYFLNNTQYGWIIGGFLRYAKLDYEYKDNDYPEDNISVHDNRIGLGLEIGYRIFSYRGLYWGITSHLGRYVIGDFDKNTYHYGSQEFIFSVEILKIGWAF